MTRSRAARLLIALTLVPLGVVGCGGDDDDGGDELNRQYGGPSKVPGVPPPAQAPDFTRTSVVTVVPTRQPSGAQADVMIVVPAQRALDAAQACVEDYTAGGRFKTAYCYAFTTRAAVDRAKVNRRRGGMSQQCYEARWGLGPDGLQRGAENDPAKESACGEQSAPRSSGAG